MGFTLAMLHSKGHRLRKSIVATKKTLLISKRYRCAHFYLDMNCKHQLQIIARRQCTHFLTLIANFLLLSVACNSCLALCLLGWEDQRLSKLQMHLHEIIASLHGDPMVRIFPCALCKYNHICVGFPSRRNKNSHISPLWDPAGTKELQTPFS